MAGTPERWLLTHDGVDHAVELVDVGISRRITWSVDGEEVASEKTSDETVTLIGGDHGVVKVKLPTFIGPARRVTWWGDEPGLPAAGAALLNRGGTDFDPEPGSKAAEREAWIRAHPRRYAAQRTAAAVAKVGGPLLLIWLLGRFALPAIPWPDWDLPSIPWPDWSIPWPTIPWPDWSIPWPDINLPRFEVTVPGWIRTILDASAYVVPVLVAAVFAQREVKRRREQDERKRQALATDADRRRRAGEDDEAESQASDPA
ncbi:hypothetical protein [Nocardioides campestrisoli]|uniref:hypothetical protein n=1 Tax=Nocardioides campestrisoli TaxID=2736757 RepID=UPI0015E7977E|nr:hypothetical protein [Nocardioides campestrisoli]